MIRVLAAITLIIVLAFVLVAGATVIGAIPLMMFDDDIGDAIKSLGRRVSA